MLVPHAGHQLVALFLGVVDQVPQLRQFMRGMARSGPMEEGPRLECLLPGTLVLGERGVSNPQPPQPQCGALPLSYARHRSTLPRKEARRQYSKIRRETQDPGG